MEPNRCRYRRPPCPRYDIPGTQRWLEEQARTGWILEYDSFFFDYASFRQDSPREIRYRLEATCTQDSIFSDRYAPNAETRELYSQMGWQYQGRRGQFHIYACEDPAAPELHSDPEIHALSLKNLNRFLTKDLCWSLVGMVVYWYLFQLRIISTGLVLLDAPWVATCVVLLGSLLLSRLWGIWKLRQYKRQLELDGQLHSNPRTKFQRWRWYLMRPVGIAMAVTLLFSSMSRMSQGLTGEGNIPLEEYRDPLPFATAGDFYPGNLGVSLVGIIDSEITSWSNWIAPENYECTQYGEVTLADGTKEDVYLTVRFHRTRFPWLARSLAEDAVEHAKGIPLERLLGEGEEVTMLDIPGADYAATWEVIRGYPNFVLVQGNVMMQVMCGDDLGHTYTPQELAQVLIANIQQ